MEQECGQLVWIIVILRYMIVEIGQVMIFW